MRIFDAHAHIFPEKIAEKATENIGRFYGITMSHNGSSEYLKESAAKIGAEGCLVCSVATRPAQVKAINDFIAGQLKENPTFVGFGTVHPYMKNAADEISRFMGMGLRGIKLHSDFQEFPIDDPEAFPIYEMAEAQGIPILFHCGDSRFGYAYSSPLRLITVLKRFPALRVQGAHFGGYSEWENVLLYPHSDNLFFDTSSSLAFLPREKARELIRTFGPEHFFFGSDFPMWDHSQELTRFLALGLPDEENEAILYTNFARFVGL